MLNVCFLLFLSESKCENYLYVFMWGKKVLSGEEGAHSDFFSGKKVLILAFHWERRFFKTLNGGRVKFFGLLK